MVGTVKDLKNKLKEYDETEIISWSIWDEKDIVYTLKKMTCINHTISKKDIMKIFKHAKNISYSGIERDSLDYIIAKFLEEQRNK